VGVLTAPGGAGRVWYDRPVSRIVHTAGLGDRSARAILDLLAGARVRVVVDVRRYGTAARHAHHAAAVLHPALRAAGYEVHDMGASLGGDRTGGYPRWMRGAAFARGLERLEAVAAASPALVLCAEREPERCHRRFLAEALEARGWTVAHHVHTVGERVARGVFRVVRRTG